MCSRPAGGNHGTDTKARQSLREWWCLAGYGRRVQENKNQTLYEQYTGDKNLDMWISEENAEKNN